MEEIIKVKVIRGNETDKEIYKAIFNNSKLS